MGIRTVAIGLCCCAISCVVLGQVPENRLMHRSLFLEAGGVAGYVSVQYQHEFWHPGSGKQACYLSGGLGTLHIRDFRRKFNPDVMVPILAGLRIGTMHGMEIGLGLTWNSLVVTGTLPESASRRSTCSPLGSIGYRYQNPNGFRFRIAFTPVLEAGRNLRPWAGISTGIAF